MLLLAQVAVAEGEVPLDKPHYSPGRFIVKLTEPAAWEIARKTDESGFIQADDLPIEALWKVSLKYGVTQWKRAFQRLPKEDPNGLGRIYLVFCDPSANINLLEVVRVFGELPELVEYAEPDYVVEAQP